MSISSSAMPRWSSTTAPSCSRAGRRQPPNGGHVLAPSTPAAARLGFLVQRTRWTAEPGVAPGSISLGRAWDEGVARGTWQAGRVAQRPGADTRQPTRPAPRRLVGFSTSRRPFAATGEQANRFFEFNNRALPADPAREVLAADGGWAAAEGGTRGGADAAPADVHTVRNRAQLVAALKPHLGADGRPGVQRPRLVKIAGRIDLAQTDDGRVLGFEDFRDPAFSWDAFEAAYAPPPGARRSPKARWKKPASAHAKRQAAQVMLAVPSNTTIVGLGAGAEIVNGGLVLGWRATGHPAQPAASAPRLRPLPGLGPERQRQRRMELGLRHADAAQRAPRLGGPLPLRRWPAATAPERVIFGRPLQRFDGLLDIIRGSQFVTVSLDSHFRGHDKTVLIGNSDRLTSDDGKLQVTLPPQPVGRRERARRRGCAGARCTCYQQPLPRQPGHRLRLFAGPGPGLAGVQRVQRLADASRGATHPAGTCAQGQPLPRPRLAAQRPAARPAGRRAARQRCPHFRCAGLESPPPAHRATPPNPCPPAWRATAGPGWLWLGAP